MLVSKRVETGLALLLSGIWSQAAPAQTVATRPDAPISAKCDFSRPARVIESLHDNPEIAAEFRRQGVIIADVGEPFIPFDVQDEASKGLPHRQFVRAYAFDDRVIAWYFHGGFGTHFHVVELRKQQGERDVKPVLHLTGRSLGGPLCVATHALLDGVTGHTDW